MRYSEQDGRLRAHTISVKTAKTAETAKKKAEKPYAAQPGDQK